VIEAGKLGELDRRSRRRPAALTRRRPTIVSSSGRKDQLVRIKRFPGRWLARLDDAINRGLLWSYPDDEIVRIMLMGPR
jgi:hypothetical protein